MTKVIVRKNGKHFGSAILWCLENCVGVWETLDPESYKKYRETNLLVADKVSWECYVNHVFSNDMTVGVFKFENPQDAMLFKLKWS